MFGKRFSFIFAFAFLVVLANCENVAVSTSAQLTAALANAKPGQVINLADGVYTATKIKIGPSSTIFGSSVTGTKSSPITLQGSSKAIIDGGDTDGDYGFYLYNVSYWILKGFTLRNAKKGIILDQSNHCVLDSLHVHTIGQEGIHIRMFSSDNIISNSLVEGTGLQSAGYGEGLYIGSANSNWGTYSGGNPDTCDRNHIIGNTIRNTTAENIDVKEGTTGGLIADNHFDGVGLSGSNYADSWIDMKGNNYSVICNTGVNALLNGFEIHTAVTGWGYYNLFSNNKIEVDSTGYGFNVQTTSRDNIITCDNVVTKADKGFGNVECVQSGGVSCESYTTHDVDVTTSSTTGAVTSTTGPKTTTTGSTTTTSNGVTTSGNTEPTTTDNSTTENVQDDNTSSSDRLIIASSLMLFVLFQLLL